MPSPSDSTSLYRRHRPGSFDEVVGQQHVVRTLRNAVEQGKVHHAYLFVGSRGTGKTSMAKILARSLNCERGGPTVTPCGECETCLTIAAGTSVDVIEMDAASNRSVDDVRDLRERVAYAPAGGRWKVYILDEAHMLTKEAWNAFLKTLEEPPPNTVFVLATTESHKVMATIADRCQRFDFQRPSLEQIATVVDRVAAAEGIEVEEAAVATIARSASGSFRDALGTLDQLVAFGGSQVALDDVLQLLGAADADLLFGAVDAVIAEDPRAVLLGVEEMARSGRDPVQFARDLLAHLRHLLVTQTVGEVPNTFVVTATDAERLVAQANRVGAATLVRTIDELAAALTAVREGDDARMAVEIALLKAARPDLDPTTENLLRRIERLERAAQAPRSPEADAPPPRDEARQPAGPVGAGDPPPPDQALQPAGPVAAGDPPAPAVAKASSGLVPPTAPPTGESLTPDAPAPDAGAPASGPEAAPAAESESAGDETEAPSAGSEAPAGAPPAGASAAPASAAADPAAGGGVGGTAPEEALATGRGGGSPAPTGPAGREASSADESPAPTGPAAPEASSADETPELGLGEIVRVWPSVLDRVMQTAPALAAIFEGARPVAVGDGEVEIGFPPNATFNKRKAEAPDKREQLVGAFKAVLGRPLRPGFILLEQEEAPPLAESPAPTGEAAAERPAPAPADPADKHRALVEKIKSEFDAEEVG